MAVARAPTSNCLRSGLYNLLLASISLPHRRCASTQTQSGGKSGHSGFVFRIRSDSAAKFFKSNGLFYTTPENARLFAKYNLEHDTGNVHFFPKRSPGLTRLAKQVVNDFGVQLRWTNRHLVDPYSQEVWDPRGHPLASMMRDKYTRKAETEALWLKFTCKNESKACVRLTAQKRLSAGLYRALEEKGYSKTGFGQDGRMIRGTLWVHIHNPLKAVNMLKEDFGRPVVKLLEDISGLAESRLSSAPRLQNLSRPSDRASKERPQARVTDRRGDRGNERGVSQDSVKPRTHRPGKSDLEW